jgi:hypothetical protein
LIIFFGDVQDNLSYAAKNYDSSAWLLDYSNYTQIINNEFNLNTVIYTSLGDLPKDLNIVWSILLKADTIFYCPPDIWSDGNTVDIINPSDSVEGLTQILLSLLPDRIQVNNLFCTMKDPNPLVDVRKTESSQLWIAGCSISHGIGVSLDERYGQLLSNELSMPCSFLTRGGSSIDWAADQILRSDIQQDDLVIFGVTDPQRFTYIHDNQLLAGVTVGTYTVHPEYKKIVDPKNLFSHQTVYTNFYAIQKVINYCKKIKAKLFLVGMLGGANGFLTFLKLQKNYIHIPYTTNFKNSNLILSFIDIGTDGIHPGPKQHEQYKQQILKHIRNVN